jgi:hypothetical protein
MRIQIILTYLLMVAISILIWSLVFYGSNIFEVPQYFGLQELPFKISLYLGFLTTLFVIAFTSKVKG